MYMNIYMCVCMSVCVELSVNTGTYIYTYNNSNSTGSDLCRPLKSTRAHTHVKKEKKKVGTGRRGEFKLSKVSGGAPRP